ncbi:cytochrome P450 [Billgrantia desiderata]|uniref:cytochrome P450 n=1 Tax=Billgrantia desiderata TaxID=52021 RepID=UPI00089F58F6|nr:cytochrome P450 [Halomonas desiderata]MCE8012496.1 cytochrome P450 [Halomonas desiderata]SEF87441.1 Cytochrome P450 [Halomonas desiderata]
MTRDSTANGLPRATAGETLAVMGDVYVPNIAKGVIIRRPKVVGVAEKLGLDERAIRRLQTLNEKYGPGPLMLNMPEGKPMALILDPDHANRVLNETPEPFATAEWAKRKALEHFEPDMALVSHGPERAERRRFNEEVLQSECPVHGLGARFVQVVEQEANELLTQVERHSDKLDWDMFEATWNRVVRRVVLGDTARDDHALTEMLEKLRSAANWAFFHPGHDRVKDEFLERVRTYLKRGEEGSLAGEVARVSTNDTTQPEHQFPQYLFAFDPAGMATFRALALLAAHPNQAERAQAEIAENAGKPAPELDFLRACLLESLRLWPTTPMVLRQTTEATEWENGTMPAETSILILAPYFHRDDRHLDEADRFNPDLWLEPDAAGDWPLIPFSGGTGICPGRRVVLTVTSHMLARLLQGREFQLNPPTRLLSSKPMPPLLNNYDLEFKVGSRQ